MKAIISLAALLVALSTSAFSQQNTDRSPNFSPADIRGGRDTMSFAQAARRRVRGRVDGECLSGCNPYCSADWDCAGGGWVTGPQAVKRCIKECLAGCVDQCTVRR
jgi:hypothetical protein